MEERVQQIAVNVASVRLMKKPTRRVSSLLAQQLEMSAVFMRMKGNLMGRRYSRKNGSGMQEQSPWEKMGKNKQQRRGGCRSKKKED
jgi:hypothetical protein